MRHWEIEITIVKKKIKHSNFVIKVRKLFMYLQTLPRSALSAVLCKGRRIETIWSYKFFQEPMTCDAVQNPLGKIYRLQYLHSPKRGHLLPSRGLSCVRLRPLPTCLLPHCYFTPWSKHPPLRFLTNNFFFCSLKNFLSPSYKRDAFIYVLRKKKKFTCLCTIIFTFHLEKSRAEEWIPR